MVAPLAALMILASNASAGNGKTIFEEVVEKTYPIDPTARFSLKNSDGSALIYGADVSEIRIRAVKKAYSKERLANIDVKIAAQPSAVAIETTFPPKPKWGLSDRSGTVDYVIILPWLCDIQKAELGAGELLIEGMRGTEVRAELGSGRMFGRNCFTDLHLSLGTGGLEVAYQWWESHRIAMATEISNGNTYVFIPADAQFRLRAQSVNGQVATNFTNHRPPGNGTRLDLAIGDQPNAEMDIKAVNGSVVIKEINR